MPRGGSSRPPARAPASTLSAGSAQPSPRPTRTACPRSASSYLAAARAAPAARPERSIRSTLLDATAAAGVLLHRLCRDEQARTGLAGAEDEGASGHRLVVLRWPPGAEATSRAMRSVLTSRAAKRAAACNEGGLASAGQSHVRVHGLVRTVGRQAYRLRGGVCDDQVTLFIERHPFVPHGLRDVILRNGCLLDNGQFRIVRSRWDGIAGSRRQNDSQHE